MKVMRTLACVLLLLSAVPVVAQTSDAFAKSSGKERLGTVSFPVSCAAGSQAAFNRGVALVHDFWYEEAKAQFGRLAANDPKCALAHWGLAMSGFHQIWDRPDKETMKYGWAELEKARKLHAGTEREQDYVAALEAFYRPGKAQYPARIAAYSAAMGKLYQKYPADVDAGAFYALSLLADDQPNDTSLGQEHEALAVLTPLFVKDPDDPGVDHYIIHACDNPAMAADGLAASNHYLEIAQSGPHAYHMPGHIYARLGLWPQDIESQLGSIAGSKRAELQGESGIMDEPHSYDFLLYAYLQSGQDERAKAVLAQMPAMLKQVEAMPGGRMAHMVPYYQTKYRVFYALEMRDWQAAEALEPVTGSSPEVSTLVYWARLIADGHLRRAEQARTDLLRYEALVDEIRKGKNAYYADGTGAKVTHSEVLGWAAFAAGRGADALSHMRAAADLQDKVGQGEVDIPAREMLADMLLEDGHAQEALAEYRVALKLSPNRLNGLYDAGRAAQAAGELQQARAYYAELLKLTDRGANSARPEFTVARNFVASAQVAKQ